jgi:predicted nucleotidyltransferase
MDKEKIIDILRAYVNALVSNRIPVAQAYLFGSTVKGTDNFDSDFDVALFLKRMQDEISTLNQLMKIRRDFDLRIEPHPFLEDDIDNGNPLVNNIIKTGEKIY